MTMSGSSMNNHNQNHDIDTNGSRVLLLSWDETFALSLAYYLLLHQQQPNSQSLSNDNDIYSNTKHIMETIIQQAIQPQQQGNTAYDTNRPLQFYWNTNIPSSYNKSSNNPSCNSTCIYLDVLIEFHKYNNDNNIKKQHNDIHVNIQLGSIWKRNDEFIYCMVGYPYDHHHHHSQRPSSLSLSPLATPSISSSILKQSWQEYIIQYHFIQTLQIDIHYTTAQQCAYSMAQAFLQLQDNQHHHNSTNHTMSSVDTAKNNNNPMDEYILNLYYSDMQIMAPLSFFHGTNHNHQPTKSLLYSSYSIPSCIVDRMMIIQQQQPMSTSNITTTTLQNTSTKSVKSTLAINDNSTTTITNHTTTMDRIIQSYMEWKQIPMHEQQQQPQQQQSTKQYRMNINQSPKIDDYTHETMKSTTKHDTDMTTNNNLIDIDSSLMSQSITQHCNHDDDEKQKETNVPINNDGIVPQQKNYDTLMNIDTNDNTNTTSATTTTTTVSPNKNNSNKRRRIVIRSKNQNHYRINNNTQSRTTK